MNTPSEQRRENVSKMFGAIAEHYDVMNRVMTLGQDQRWRRQAADVAQLRPGDQVLDVAAGTGDLAFELAKRVGDRGRVIGIDFADPMLTVARRKATIRRSPVSFEVGDCLKLPYEDCSFDAVTCAFGVRNFEDRPRGMKEMTRVARPGGRVVILELTPPRSKWTRLYMDEVIPRLGQLVAQAREAYTYLPDSAEKFPDAQTLGRMMQDAGLRSVTYRLLNFGTVALHWGLKPSP